jgi:hypothetical protein
MFIIERLTLPVWCTRSLLRRCMGPVLRGQTADRNAVRNCGGSCKFPAVAVLHLVALDGCFLTGRKNEVMGWSFAAMRLGLGLFMCLSVCLSDMLTVSLTHVFGRACHVGSAWHLIDTTLFQKGRKPWVTTQQSTQWTCQIPHTLIPINNT